jgi:hypothetical protein
MAGKHQTPSWLGPLWREKKKKEREREKEGKGKRKPLLRLSRCRKSWNCWGILFDLLEIKWILLTF